MNCVDCSVLLVPARAWLKMTAEQRAATGGSRKSAHGRCARCDDLARRGPRTTRRLEDVIEEAEFLFEGGTPTHEVAVRLGYTAKDLIRLYYRAKARGLTKRHLTESHRRNA